jgi:hypothetical protein
MPCNVSKCGGSVRGVRSCGTSCGVKTACCVPKPKCHKESRCGAECPRPPCDVEVTKTLIDVATISGVTGLSRIYTWDVKIHNKSCSKISCLEVIDNFSGLKLNTDIALSEVVGNFTSVSATCDSITVYSFADVVANAGALVDKCKSWIPACTECHVYLRMGVADFRVGNDGTQAPVDGITNACNKVSVRGKFATTDGCGCCTIECPFAQIDADGKDCCGNVPCLLE